MTWRDAILIATTSIRRRLSRAILTVLAVALASALLSSLLIAGDVARSRVLDQVSKGGPLSGIRVDAAAPLAGTLDSDNPRRLGAPKAIDDAALRRIRSLPGVRSVLSIREQSILVVPPSPAVIASSPTAILAKPKVQAPKSFLDGIVGADLRKINDLPVTVLKGRLPLPAAMNEVAVTPAYLDGLGLDSTQSQYVIGTEIEYASGRQVVSNRGPFTRGRWVRALVVGVVAQDIDNHVQILGSQQAVVAASTWSRPTASGATSAADPQVSVAPVSPYVALFVVADSLQHVPAVRRRINDVGYATSAPEQLIANIQRYVHVVEIVLGGIGLIGLIIAALGISNAMFAAVRERRREIGVLKAIGARDRDVRRVFLLEAGALGALGGGIGTITGWGIASILAAVVNNYLRSQGFVGVAVGFPLVVALGGVLGAALLALIAGMLPAQLAARLPARQAMGDQ